MGALGWWLSPHPDWEDGEDWPEEVPVVRYETEEEVVLFDPFLPADGSFDPGGKPVRVLLTQGAHYRGTADFVERYGASIWAPPKARWRKIANPATTDALPRGVEAIELDGEPQQVLFFIREHSTLVSGDVLTGRDGAMHVFVDEADREPLLVRVQVVPGPCRWTYAITSSITPIPATPPNQFTACSREMRNPRRSVGTSASTPRNETKPKASPAPIAAQAQNHAQPIRWSFRSGAYASIAVQSVARR